MVSRHDFQDTLVDEHDAALDAYRGRLEAAEQKAQEDFDRTVLALSGGALGISFTFLKEVIGANPISHAPLLLVAWLAWATSTLVVLLSYHLSHMALRRAIRQVDAGTVRSARPGGVYARVTAMLNLAGALFFATGVVAITGFAGLNFTAKGAPHGDTKASSIAWQAAADTEASQRARKL